MAGTFLKSSPGLLKACPHERCSEALGQYAFPHLNLEDLTAPNSLLILLDSRTRHAPFKSALSDYELAPLLRFRPALLERIKYTMCMHDADFGGIVEWDTLEDAEEVMPATAGYVSVTIFPVRATRF